MSLTVLLLTFLPTAFAEYVDLDGDGWDSSVDCDDYDAAVGRPGTWYADADADGFGSTSQTVESCDWPSGYTDDSADCDDTTPEVNPAGDDFTCDGVDQDCDGIDCDGGGGDVPRWWLPDEDADGWGTWDGALYQVEQPAGTVGQYQGGDCDDTNDGVNPGQEEICGDEVDENCDGWTDQGNGWYPDADGDGWSDPTDEVISCEAVDGRLPYWTAADCDDTDPTSHPYAEDVCGNGVDEDCDGAAYDGTNWSPDLDADGYGDGTYAAACDQPDGTVEAPWYWVYGWMYEVDCDDSDPTSYPYATEVCGNDVDEDCDGADYTGTNWSPDQDGDGYGDGTWEPACEQPEGTVEAPWWWIYWGWLYLADCDDTSDTIHPYAEDVCGNGIDEDCDGWAYDGGAWSRDQDGDGYGAWDGQYYCEQPADATWDWSDCDDGDADVNPDAEEICGDGTDDNCDGYDATYVGWYTTDADLDGFGTYDWGWYEVCSLEGLADNGDDCDDDDPRAPGLHDCVGSHAGGDVAVQWSDTDWIDGYQYTYDECGGRAVYLYAVYSRSHTAGRGVDGAPGAPTRDTWAYADYWAWDWCTWSFGGGSYYGDDVRLAGSGMRRHLTGTVASVNWSTGETVTVDADVTWSASGDEEWRDQVNVTDATTLYWYRYAGTARPATASGTIGTLQVDSATGWMSSRRDSTFRFWLE